MQRTMRKSELNYKIWMWKMLRTYAVKLLVLSMSSSVNEVNTPVQHFFAKYCMFLCPVTTTIINVPISVWAARCTKCLTTSRRKEARISADNEEKYITPSEESEAERKREEKLINPQQYLASSRNCADKLTMKLRIQDNSTAKHLASPERIAEVTLEEHKQALEIKATH